MSFDTRHSRKVPVSASPVRLLPQARPGGQEVYSQDYAFQVPVTMLTFGVNSVRPLACSIQRRVFAGMEGMLWLAGVSLTWRWTFSILGLIVAGSSVLPLVLSLARSRKTRFERSEWVEEVHHTFPISGPARLQIHNYTGTVHILPGAAGQISLQITKHTRAVWEHCARRALRQMGVSIWQQSDALNLEVSRKWSLWRSSAKFIDILVHLPGEADLQVEQQAGNILVEKIMGNMSMRLARGDVRLHQVHLVEGAELSIQIGTLFWEGTLHPGAALVAWLKQGNATLCLPPETAAHLEAGVHAGKLTFSGWPVPVIPIGEGACITGDLGTHPTRQLEVRVMTGHLEILPAGQEDRNGNGWKDKHQVSGKGRLQGPSKDGVLVAGEGGEGRHRHLLTAAKFAKRDRVGE